MICKVNIEKAFYNKKQVLSDISFEVKKGGILAIVGESGAGKTTLGRLISGLYRFYPLTYKGYIKAEATVDVVPQNITDSLDPVFTIENQMLEIENNVSLIKETLTTVGFPNPDEILKAYPHNLSGGMRQRVLIAMALLRAEIILADEFTSALDMITKIRVVKLLKKLNSQKNITIIFITHDMELLDFDGEIMVLFDGKVLEKGPIGLVRSSPLHPYTHFLMNASPKLGMNYLSYRFEEIEIDRDFACPFFRSCPLSKEVCKSKEPSLKVKNNRWIRCHF